MPRTGSVFSALSPILFPPFWRKTMATGVDHLPAQGGYILAPAHIDWLDGFYVAAAIDKYRQVPTNFLARSNNYWWTGIVVQIPHDRGAIIDNAVEQLRRGKVICNFPEGQRNTSSQLLPGKTGTVRMAAEAGVPVIPVGITCDAGRNMGQSLKHLFSSEHAVKLIFGQSMTFTIPPGDITAEWLTTETERLMQAIAALSDKTV